MLKPEGTVTRGQMSLSISVCYDSNTSGITKIGKKKRKGNATYRVLASQNRVWKGERRVLEQRDRQITSIVRLMIFQVPLYVKNCIM